MSIINKFSRMVEEGENEEVFQEVTKGGVTFYNANFQEGL